MQSCEKHGQIILQNWSKPFYSIFLVGIVIFFCLFCNLNMEIITKFIELRIFGFTANQTVVVCIGVVIYIKQGVFKMEYGFKNHSLSDFKLKRLLFLNFI